MKKLQKKIGKIKKKGAQFDVELLRHWKKCSTKAKLEWLESAMRFGKLKKF